MQAPLHVLEAVDAQMNVLTARSTRPETYDQLYLSRGVLHTPDGEVPLKRIGKGMFAEVYEEQPAPGKSLAKPRVFAFVAEDNYDKDIAADVYDGKNPHVPAVERFGSTMDDRKVFVMPKYKAPFRKGDNPEGWRSYTLLKKCRDKANFSHKNRSGYEINEETIDCATAVPPALALDMPLIEALEDLKDTAASYNTEYTFEFAPRNLATDDKGNLVLLDVLFDAEAVRKMRRAKAKAKAKAKGSLW